MLAGGYSCMTVSDSGWWRQPDRFVGGWCLQRMSGYTNIRAHPEFGKDGVLAYGARFLLYNLNHHPEFNLETKET